MPTGYTSAERRVIDVVLDQIDQKRVSRLSHAQVAERAKVSKSTVRVAIDKAVRLNDLKVTHRIGEENVVRRA